MIFGRAISRFKNNITSSVMSLDEYIDWRKGDILNRSVSQSAALKLSAVAACVDVLTNSMAKLPLHIMDKKTKEVVHTPLSDLLSLRPNEAMSPSVFKRLVETYRLLWGNAYVLAVRSARNGRISELLPLPADFVVPVIADNGALWYVFTNPRTGEIRKFRSWDIVHIKNFSYDGITGVSTLKRASDVIATAKAAQEYEDKFYSQSARPSGILMTASQVDKGAKDKIREEWNKIHSGTDNAFKIAVLDLGFDYKQISLSNRDAQFIEGKGISVEDIARFFGIPLYKINSGKQSYSSNEQNAIEYVTGTLHPAVEQYEEEFTYKMLFNAEIHRGLEIKANLMAELRGDSKSRGLWYKYMREVGAFSVNDILALEDMPPVDGGDVRIASLNYVPLDDFREISKNRNTETKGSVE